MTVPVTMCEDCRAQACDCEAPIWGYWWHAPNDKTPIWSGARPRSAALSLWREKIGAIVYGDVQRLTEPCPFYEPKRRRAPGDGPVCPHAIGPRGALGSPGISPATACCICGDRGASNDEAGRFFCGLGKCDNPPRINVTQEELARLLFEAVPYHFEQAVLRAELPPTAMLTEDPEAQAKLQRVFDIMWDSSEPGWRQRAEERAGLVFARAQSRKP